MSDTAERRMGVCILWVSTGGSGTFLYVGNNRRMCKGTGSCLLAVLWSYSHQYINQKYPIPYEPPYVPSENPCGAYKKVFHVDKRPNETTYLNFEGVDSCFYVWVNGMFVGYSQVSHATSEFDITKYIVDGENILAVLVLKWCDGTYLEDQDKLRMSGFSEMSIF